MNAIWSSALKCCWLSWSVVDDGILRLDMPAGSCCSMDGAIKVAQAICMGVWRIDTYAGGRPDTMYVLNKGKWEVAKHADLLFNTYPAVKTLEEAEIEMRALEVGERAYQSEKSRLLRGGQ